MQNSLFLVSDILFTIQQINIYSIYFFYSIITNNLPVFPKQNFQSNYSYTLPLSKKWDINFYPLKNCHTLVKFFSNVLEYK